MLVHGLDMEKKDVRIQLVMSSSEIAALDDWRADHRIWSRSEAIRRLVNSGAERPDDAEQKTFDKGLWEMLLQVSDGKSGAMTAAKHVVELIKARSPELLAIMRSYAEDADERESKRKP